jgi:hypothetical protein
VVAACGGRGILEREWVRDIDGATFGSREAQAPHDARAALAELDERLRIDMPRAHPPVCTDHEMHVEPGLVPRRGQLAVTALERR